MLWELVPIARQTCLEGSSAGECSSSGHDTSSNLHVLVRSTSVYLTYGMTAERQGCGISPISDTCKYYVKGLTGRVGGRTY